MLNEIEMACAILQHEMDKGPDNKNRFHVKPLSPAVEAYLSERTALIKSIQPESLNSPEYWTYNQPNPIHAPDFITFKR